ncbi:hypothetical protein [Actinoplanes solisilvae]|uniref:hypothetical protein n=1 Tax=Actinoplanes solisilvae TaxID=2486853 RepID=UPI000FD834CF|nr:hypothetical protein [Actinoplanes solisilvae]
MKAFRRAFGIGLTGQVVIFALLIAGVFVSARLGGEGGATVAALSFLPALVVVGFVYLVALLVVAAVPALRAKAGSGPGLLLGWLAGAVVVTAVIAVVFALN